MQYFRKIKNIIIAIIIIVCGLLYVISSDLKKAEIDIEANTTYEQNIEYDIQTETESVKNIYVYITGEVKESGVFVVGEGNRVYDVIVLAGGLTEDADAKSVNMARCVVDGEHIHVCKIGEIPSDFATEDALININSASKEKLMELPGIGESRAISIIKYREKYGLFKTIEDIMKVSGIKQAAFDKIREYICVN